MDARVHQISAALGVVLLTAGIGFGAKDFLAKASPMSVEAKQPIIPKAGEFAPITLKDGSSWALVKAWAVDGGLELFNPSVPPSSDLKIVTNAIATGKYSGFVFETKNDQGAIVWGWMLRIPPCPSESPVPCSKTSRNISDFEFVPITEHLARANSELFKTLRPSNKKGASP